MKRIITNVSSLMVVALLFTAAGYAQRVFVKADVPFEFKVGQQTLPAGEYRITQIASNTLALRDSNNRQVAVALTSPMISYTPGFTAKLRFDSKDGHSVLSEVWADGGTGYELFVHKQLTALAQKQRAGTKLQATMSSSVGK